MDVVLIYLYILFFMIIIYNYYYFSACFSQMLMPKVILETSGLQNSDQDDEGEIIILNFLKLCIRVNFDLQALKQLCLFFYEIFLTKFLFISVKKYKF